MMAYLCAILTDFTELSDVHPAAVAGHGIEVVGTCGVVLARNAKTVVSI